MLLPNYCEQVIILTKDDGLNCSQCTLGAQQITFWDVPGPRYGFVWCKITADRNASISDPRALHIHGLAPVKMQKLCRWESNCREVLRIELCPCTHLFGQLPSAFFSFKRLEEVHCEETMIITHKARALP